MFYDKVLAWLEWNLQKTQEEKYETERKNKVLRLEAG